MDLEPGWIGAWNDLAACQEALGKAREAVESYRRILHQGPDLPQAWYNYGNAQVEVGDLSGARDSYLEGLRLHIWSAQRIFHP